MRHATPEQDEEGDETCTCMVDGKLEQEEEEEETCTCTEDGKLEQEEEEEETCTCKVDGVVEDVVGSVVDSVVMEDDDGDAP